MPNYPKIPDSPDVSLAAKKSRLLASLPLDLLDRLLPDLELVSLLKSDPIMEPDRQIDHIYFPTGCLISIVVSFDSGVMIEAMVVGNDGFTGMPLLFGVSTATTQAMVQVPGQALRMKTSDFTRHLLDERFRQKLGAYSILAYRRLAQSTGCVAFHPVEQRLARWLLLVQDGIDEEEFLLTQEFIGVMLGVHRPTVTIAVRLLEGAKLIEHRRGRIKVVDRAGLESAACECYAASEARPLD